MLLLLGENSLHMVGRIELGYKKIGLSKPQNIAPVMVDGKCSGCGGAWRREAKMDSGHSTDFMNRIRRIAKYFAVTIIRFHHQ
jgi:hypothetical protein